MKQVIVIAWMLLGLQPLLAQELLVPAYQNDDIMLQMGYKNDKGKWVIKPQFDFAREFGEDGWAMVLFQGRVAFIDAKGKIQLSVSGVDDAQNFNYFGMSVVRQMGKYTDAHEHGNDKYGAIDRQGRFAVGLRYSQLSDNSFPFTFVAQIDHKKWGIIDLKGRTLLDFSYDMINVHKSKQAAIVRVDSITGVIDHQFKWLVPMGDNMARFSGSNTISLYEKGKFGYINFRGEQIAPYVYDEFAVFRDRLCMVRKNGLLGFIDTLGNEVVPFEYSKGEMFVNDTAIMTRLGKAGMINSRNEVLVPFEYDRISRFFSPRPPGGFVLIKDAKYYYLDPKTGEVKKWESF